MKKDYKIFIASIFFVLGFSVIFSLLGVLLQSVLSNVSYQVQTWLSRIGGIIIILFGLTLTGLLSFNFLEKEHKLNITKTKSTYITSFLFGAAFAVGWTPCVGPILGVILTLAVTNPTSAFFFLLAYSLGLGIPFLLVGLFTNQATEFIKKGSKWLNPVRIIFGIITIILGILVFTDQLKIIANFEFASSFLITIDAVGPSGSPTIILSFFAGLVSFLSPCILPLIPAFLTFLATTITEK